MEMTASVITERLSDGSMVYNVAIRDDVDMVCVPCINEDCARELIASIARNTLLLIR